MPDEQDNWLPPPVTQQSLTHAFAEWCQQRECHAESCELRVESERLIVTGTGSWRDKLHGESWLVVGEGALRTALTLELG
jgi:hypothetical protein